MTSNTESLNLDAADVPDRIKEQLKTLNDALSSNLQHFTACKEINVGEELRNLEEKTGKLAMSISSHKSILKKERLLVAGTAKKLGLDQRIAYNVQRTRDNLSKNPQFGRVHTVDFLHEVATQNEQSLVEQCEIIEKLRKMLGRLLNSDEEPQMSRNDLIEHLNRFDNIFEQVATQVYALDDSTEKLRDLFLEQRRKFYGQFADPFDKQKEPRRLIDVFSALKGIDAFPQGQVRALRQEGLTQMQIGERLRQSKGVAQKNFISIGSWEV